MLPAGDQPTASSVHYTTSCTHSLVLLRMGEIIARNMLSWLKLLIKLLLLHLVGCLYWIIHFKIWILIHLDAVYWRQPEYEDPWLFFEAKKGYPWAKCLKSAWFRTFSFHGIKTQLIGFYIYRHITTLKALHLSCTVYLNVRHYLQSKQTLLPLMIFTCCYVW